jgi:hypothetical protein
MTLKQKIINEINKIIDKKVGYITNEISIEDKITRLNYKDRYDIILFILSKLK